METTFISNTNHIDNLVGFIEKTLLPSIPKHTFLDIGAGPGHITHQISKYFAFTLVIEPNASFTPLYNHYGFEVCQSHFEHVQLNGLCNLILCSHSLYHIDRNKWSSCLQKIHDSLIGVALIVIVAPQGTYHELCHSINPNYAQSKEVTRRLDELKISYTVTHTVSKVDVANFEDFKQLVYLFVIADCYTTTEFTYLSNKEQASVYDKIDHFLPLCKKSDGRFELVAEDDYIVVHKDM